MFGFFKLSISDKAMSKTMYALLITKGKLVNSNNLGLERFTRRQNSGNMVDVVVELKEGQIELFEELAGVKLKTSKEFQGEMILN